MPTSQNALNIQETGLIVYNPAVPIFDGVSLASSSSSLTISNANGTGGNPTFALASNLQTIGQLSGTGYLVQTSSGWAERTFQAGSGITLSNPDGVSGNTTITASSSVPLTFDADTGSATPSSNTITFEGTSAQGLSSSATGATVTYTIANASTGAKGVASFVSTYFSVSSGAVSTNPITFTAGNGISISSSSVNLGGSTTISINSPLAVAYGGTGDTTLTQNGVLYGNGTSAIGATSAGTTNTVLLGNTGSAPSFGTVPNGALTNSSITLSNGTNISISGSPVSLGGTATVNVAGPITPTSYTTNGVLYGNGTGALQATAQGGANTVLLGNNGTPSFGQVPNAALANSSITFTAGTNVSFNVSSPATVALGGALTINASAGSSGGGSTVLLYEEFLGRINTISSTKVYYGQSAWTLVNSYPSTSSQIMTGSGTNPGQIQFTIGNGSGNSGIILSDVTLGNAISVGAGSITANFIFYNPGSSASQNMTGYFGFAGQLPIASGGGIYVTNNYAKNSGNYQCVCTTFFGVGGDTTTVNTSIAPGSGSAGGSGYDHVTISINASGTSVSFTINGTSVATISTNIPSSSVQMNPTFQVNGSGPSGEYVTFDIDEFDMTINLTTSR